MNDFTKTEMQMFDEILPTPVNTNDETEGSIILLRNDFNKWKKEVIFKVKSFISSHDRRLLDMVIGMMKEKISDIHIKQIGSSEYQTAQITLLQSLITELDNLKKQI